LAGGEVTAGINVSSPVSPTATISWLVSVLIIIASAAALALPCILVGLPHGNDSFHHVMYQYHFSRQFWEGDLYPRWLPEANKGYGSPMFLFQYPLPYYLTALLRPVLGFAPDAVREGRELGIFCFLMLAGSGVCAWVWFRNRCTSAASTIAALVYMSMPYLIGQVLYGRAAIGELATFLWVPLIFAFCDHIQKGRPEFLGATALAFALLILSNVMYTAMFTPVIVVYSAAVTRCSATAMLRVILALVLGIGISAIYIFPFVDYKKFLDLGAMARYHQQVELGRQFLYFTPSDVHNRLLAVLSIAWAVCLTCFVGWRIWLIQRAIAVRFALLALLGLGAVLFIPGVGPLLIELSGLKVSGFESDAYSLRMLITALLTLALGLLAYGGILGGRADPREHVLAAVACISFFLMLPWSAGLWRAFPATWVIQFPWRLCSILSVAVAGLFAIGLDGYLGTDFRERRKPYIAGLILFAAAVAITGDAIWRVDVGLRWRRTPTVDVVRWLEYPFATFVYPPAVVNFAARVGSSPYTYDVDPTPAQDGIDAQCVDARGFASVVRVTPTSLLVSAECETNALIRIGQIYFPLWTAVPITQSDSILTLRSSEDGLIEVSLPAGKHDFKLVFGGGFAERAGLVVSAASIAVLLAGFVLLGWRRFYSGTSKVLV
jgi:hypothetical protein